MSEPYYYVATPYSKYPKGHQAAFEEACKAGSFLVRGGLKVFVPIVHTHPLNKIGKLSPPETVSDHEFWLGLDRPFIEGASGLVVVMMEGWAESSGVLEEIAAFEKAMKPVLYLPWDDAQMELTGDMVI